METSTADIDLPLPVRELVRLLAASPDVVAVSLGGSRAGGSHDAASDWDLGLYYRGAIDLAPLAARGAVSPPGAWGRIMNGGAWLDCGGFQVDVLLRDLDVVEHWTRCAERGEFEVDALLGYIAGAPTYLLAAELASCRLLAGSLAAVNYPPRLAAEAPARWRFCRSFSLDYARGHARHGNRSATLGQAAKAVMEEGHAILCERSEWICNEKRLLECAGLPGVNALFEQVPTGSGALVEWVDRVADALGAPAGEITAWSEAGRRASRP